MSFCSVKRVSKVGPHIVPDQPERNRADLNVLWTEDGTQFVSQKIDGTKQRYSEGDLVVHIPHGAKLPPELQARLGARDPVIKAGNLSGVRSNGMLMPVAEVKADAELGEDVTETLGIKF